MCCIDEDNNKLKGIRINMTTSHSAAGMPGPAWITVNGLDKSKFILLDEEFNRHKFIFAMWTQGLTISGGRNPMDKGHGRTFFMWRTKYVKYSACEGEQEPLLKLNKRD